MNIFVGNLAHDLTEDELRDAFSSYGTVARATIVKDRMTGQPRGFGFVEMATREAAEAAIAEMNGKELHGRPLTVNVAKPRTDRPRTGGGGYRGERVQSRRYDD